LEQRAGDPVAQLMAADVARQLARPADAYALLDDPPAEGAVETELRRMRKAAVEAGN
jgi:hypothetical protein